MIAIKLMGGLGNMLFQIATGETWRKRGHSVVYTNMDDNLDYIAHSFAFRRHSDVYKKLFENFDWDEYKAPKGVMFTPRKVPFTYTEIEPQDGVEYIGYFQSAKNFPDHDFVRWLFEPSEWTLSQMSFPICNYSCSIHVRRQDYLNLQDYHNVLDKEYYGLALLGLSSQNRIDKYYVFSDDIKWCKYHFTGDEFEFMTCMEYVALYLMGICRYNVIANSSLSWWGAFLGEPEERVVIAPQIWFGLKGENSKDLIPENWIRL